MILNKEEISIIINELELKLLILDRNNFKDSNKYKTIQNIIIKLKNKRSKPMYKVTVIDLTSGLIIIDNKKM